MILISIKFENHWFRCKRWTRVNSNSSKNGLTGSTWEGTDYVYPGYSCIFIIFHSVCPWSGSVNTSGKNILPFLSLSVKETTLTEYSKSPRASLVVQWLRICLLMQGTRVRALVWEDPTCRGATGPVSHNY